MYVNFSDKPDPPVVGRVTHCSVELFWDQENKHAELDLGPEERIKYCVQEEEGNSRRYRRVYWLVVFIYRALCSYSE